MNLWLRLLRIVVSGLLGAGLRLPGDTSKVSFRVWLHDLDPMRHMNNGRYLTIMDLGRVDLMVRSGLGRVAWAKGWSPIASAVVIRYRREMRLWQKFRLETRIVWWDDTVSIIEQTFVLDGGRHDGQIAARALFKGGIYDRGERRFVPVARLMQELAIDVAVPPLTQEIAAYLETDAAMQRAGRDTQT